METTLIAGIATAVTQIRFDDVNLPYLPSPGLATLLSLAVAAVWALVALNALNYVRSFLAAYISSILVETGLLYLAIEHDPHDRMRSLGGMPALPNSPARGKADISFKKRMYALVTRYAACANSLGFQPYPAAWRLALVSMVGAALGVAVLFGYIAVQSLDAARLGMAHPAFALKLLGNLLVWLILGIFIVDHPRRSAPKIALADVLVGDDETGQAVLSRR